MKGFYPGDPRAVAAGRRGGVAVGEARRRRRERRWRRLGIDPIVAQEIRQQGYNSGWRKGFSRGLQVADERRAV